MVPRPRTLCAQLGKMLANTLKYAFFDTDTMVEMTHDKRKVSDIFQEYGEEYFRCGL